MITTKYENNCKSYVSWAVDMFNEYFNNQITELLKNFSSNAVTSEGNLFWSGGKRCPVPIELDVNNNLHMDFIISSVTLLCYCTNIEFSIDKNQIINIINKNYKKGECINENIYICSPQTFNTDLNYHVKWINIASNIRALNYSIDPVNFYTTKGIAGKIIPSIITSSSIVAGLSTIEMIKYLTCNKINNYKSTFINLSSNIFISAEPVKHKTLKIAGQEFNQWFKFIEKEDLTLKDFLEKYNKLFKTTITMISLDSSLIYADFMDNNIDIKFSNLIKDSNYKYTLTLSTDDETIDLPNIILFL